MSDPVPTTTPRQLRDEAKRFRAMHDNGERPWVSDAGWVADDLAAAAAEIERLRAVLSEAYDVLTAGTGETLARHAILTHRLGEALRHGG